MDLDNKIENKKLIWKRAMTSLLPDSPVKPVKVQPDLEVAHYVVTAHKSSSVSRALKCSFLEPMGDVSFHFLS